MDALLTLLGMLFSMFLVLAATVEVTLEMFRGTLERFGITWAKGKVSLDDALALSKEFAPDNADLNARLEAVKTVAKQVEKKAAEKISQLDRLKDEISSWSTDTAGGIVGRLEVHKVTGQLNELVTSIKADLEDSERKRVFIIRCLAVLLGCFLTWQSHFYVFQLLANASESHGWLNHLPHLKEAWVNILVGGFGAAAGSSYWHDKLDQLRNLKGAIGPLKS